MAIVGSGPAGLAAAQQLARAGHAVTVFEKSDRIGGLLRYGIPNFKMEKHLIDRRLEQMAAEGVEFAPTRMSASTLRRANCSAISMPSCWPAAPSSRAISEFRAASWKGIHFAMDFLPQPNDVCRRRRVPNQAQILATGKRVVIIGGGDTGADCLGTSHRQGAAHVTQFELHAEAARTRARESTPWPLWPMQLRVESSHEEGGLRDWGVSTVKFTGDAHGSVSQLHAIRVTAPPEFKAIAGAEFSIDADLILLAMGFTAPLLPTPIVSLGVERDMRGNVATGDGYMSTVPGIFAAGDMRRGQSLIVWAIAEGRKAAAEIHRWLSR